MNTGQPPQKRDVAVPGEPWQHVLTFVGVAIALFFLCMAIFHVLERTL